MGPVPAFFYAAGQLMDYGVHSWHIRQTSGRAHEIDSLPTLIEFDAGSLVLTAFGRVNAGTVRGDMDLAERYLNLFFRI